MLLKSQPKKPKQLHFFQRTKKTLPKDQSPFQNYIEEKDIVMYLTTPVFNEQAHSKVTFTLLKKGGFALWILI